MTAQSIDISTRKDDSIGASRDYDVRPARLPGVTQAGRALDEALDQLLANLAELQTRLGAALLPTAKRTDESADNGEVWDGSELARVGRLREQRVGIANGIVDDLLARLDV